MKNRRANLSFMTKSQGAATTQSKGKTTALSEWQTTALSEWQTNEQRIYSALAAIPAGKVATYGQIAELAALPRAARLVGQVLSKLPDDTQLPWHRVINAAGKISLSEDSPSFKVQKKRLQDEGIDVINNRINLKQFQWHG
mgnify:FL=1|tara:strand:- start:8307 stop:8729 length:423 start_codon:yes stop_codon:yes gene_type:complete